MNLEGFGLLLPVRPGEKRTDLNDWPNVNVQPDIPKGHNVALRLEQLTDLDLDCPEAIAVAAQLIDGTCSFGRPPGTGHYLFSVPESKSEIFKDTDGSTLLEIRHGSSHYTVIPPSKIPRKSDAAILDELRWTSDVAPRAVTLDELRLVACVIATAALVIRHWPSGGRHNGLLALAGFLARQGMNQGFATALLDQITRQAEGGVWSECSTSVRDTYAKFDAGDKTTGAGELEKWLGGAVVDRLREFFRDDKRQSTFPLTEMGDAECFADLYQDRVRYDHRQGRWLVSDDTSGIWLPDPVEQLTQLAAAMMRSRQRDALALSGDKKKAAIAWAIKGEQRNRLTSAQVLARSVPPIADPGDNWDQEPFLLGVQNGVVDLRTGEFRKAEALDRITMRVRVPFDAAAECPLWLDTLAAIFAPTALTHDLVIGNQSQIMTDFMQRAVGYSITGDCREECCFFTWGEGCNGKGTVMNTLGWLLGDYTDDMPYSTLEKQDRGNAIPSDVAKLVGKRFITCSEVNEFDLNEARLKALTGRDPITARFLHHDWFTFQPVCKIWIATNNKPNIIGQDDGIWRRIHLIPFAQKFEGRENKQLKDQLRAELPGILNWIIQGSRIWLAEGLNPPELVKSATTAYRHESNPLTPFIDSCCYRDDHLRLQAGPAFEAYTKFCQGEQVDSWKRLSDKRFAKEMRKMFKVSEGRHTFYLGLGLKTSGSIVSASETTDLLIPKVGQRF